MYNYKYIGLNKLKNDMTNLELDNYSKINLILYSIDNINRVPFLKFILINDKVQNEFNILQIKIYREINNLNIDKYIKIYLQSYFRINEYKEISEKIIINGYYEYKEELYFFINTTNIISNIEFNLENNMNVIIDEILNKNSLNQK